jgi:hypothetical protein
MGLVLSVIVLATPEWKTVSSSEGITVEARPVTGSPFAELRATTTVAVPVEALCAGAFGTSLVDPKEPSLKSRRVISESPDERVAYDRISPPVVNDRDYTVRTHREQTDRGRCRVTVDIANELAPAPSPSVVRLEKLRCAWDFEPQPDGRTKLTYVMWADPNTSLPAFMVEPSRHELMVVWVKLVIERGKAWVRAGPPSQ